MAAQLSPEQLSGIARQFGTPVYIYHAERIREQYQRLTSAFADTDDWDAYMRICIAREDSLLEGALEKIRTALK